jgi:hypothetical protein
MGECLGVRKELGEGRRKRRKKTDMKEKHVFPSSYVNI